MKRTFLSLLLCALLALGGCSAPGGESASSSGDASFSVVATTYPVYLFSSALCAGVDGVSVSRLNTGEISCLHDYTLSVADMKLLEGADLLAMNGAGLEDFMDDALASSQAQVVDCSQSVELLPAQGHEGHDHETEYDPHIWMDPDNASRMLDALAAALKAALPDQAQAIDANLSDAQAALPRTDERPLSGVELITFHNGFSYFAQYTGAVILTSIEEEEGSEASAKEIMEIVNLVEEHQLPAVFTEVNGSDATAQAIARETGCQVHALSMLMSGPDVSSQDAGTIISDYYVQVIEDNINTIREAML